MKKGDWVSTCDGIGKVIGTFWSTMVVVEFPSPKEYYHSGHEGVNGKPKCCWNFPIIYVEKLPESEVVRLIIESYDNKT